MTTDEAFDAAGVPAYAGDHAEIYARIDQDLEVHVSELQRWVRQRSISAQNDGIRQMADLPSGETTMNLGVKGILYFELEAQGGDWGGPTHAEIHGANKAIVDATAIRLIQAIASMTTPDGNTILIPTYYDGIRPPSLDEQQLINGLAKHRQG